MNFNFLTPRFNVYPELFRGKRISEMASIIRERGNQFNTQKPIYYNVTGFEYEDISDPNGLSVNRRDLVSDAFRYFHNLTGIHIRKTYRCDRDQTIFFKDNVSDRNNTISWHTHNHDHSKIINLSPTLGGGSSAIGSRTWQTVLHEIGHALGLGHPGDYNARDENGNLANITWSSHSEYYNDTLMLSNMSYFDVTTDAIKGQLDHKLIHSQRLENNTMMPSDHWALQAIFNQYKPVDRHEGKTVLGQNTTISEKQDKVWYDFSKNMSTGRFYYTDLADGKDDTLDVSNSGDDQIVNLMPTDVINRYANWSSLGGAENNFAFGPDSEFEIVKTGQGEDVIYDNYADNRIYSGGGNDTLYSRYGKNVLEGGPGDDDYYVKYSERYNLISEQEYEGTDTVFAERNFALPNNVEVLVLQEGSPGWHAVGNDQSNYIYGNEQNNHIYGKNGRDEIYGGIGEDIIEGGWGSDTLTGNEENGGFDNAKDIFKYTDTAESWVGERWRDKIVGFQTNAGINSDKIDLSIIDAWRETRFQDEKFVFIGSDSFSGRRGEIRYDNSLQLVQVNTDSNVSPNMEIEMIDSGMITSDSFILELC